MRKSELFLVLGILAALVTVLVIPFGKNPPNLEKMGYTDPDVHIAQVPKSMRNILSNRTEVSGVITTYGPSLIGPPQLTMAARCLGTYRVTRYADGKHQDGTPFRGRYHTAASRIAPKRTWLYIPNGDKATVVYVNDTFGPVKHKGKILAPETVNALVEAGVLSAVDLAACAADDLGVAGDAKLPVWQIYPREAEMTQ